MKKTLTAAAFALGLLASGAPALAAAPAHAAGASVDVTGVGEAWNDRDRHDRRGWEGDRRHDRYDRYDRYDRGSRYNRGDRYYGGNTYGGGYQGYNENVRYDGPRTWRGDDGRHYCRRNDGSTGLVIGAVLGGVVGHEVAGRRGDRTLGTILGGAAGALLGREVDRGGSSCR